MRRLCTHISVLSGAITLLIISVVIAVVSLYPIVTSGTEINQIIDDSFTLTPLEMRRHGLGSFRGDENLSLSILNPGNSPINFSLVTYSGPLFSTVSSEDIEYSFSACSEYHEAIFLTDSDVASELDFQVSVQKRVVIFPFSWLSAPAQILFLLGLGSIIVLLFKPALHKTTLFEQDSKSRFLSRKGRRVFLILTILSLSFWFFLLVLNTNSLASFENWYTDHARHSYSSTLFTKVGFSIFGTPLGKLSSSDISYYKFVTWPQMAYIYPLGSIFLFLPFGLLLQSGVNQIFVFKMEIALFLLFAHVCLYYFLERFWKKKMFPFLKLVVVYAMYIPLIVYTANGMYDAVPFLFSLIALDMYLTERNDLFLLFISVSVLFKYQAVLFLMPLIMMGLLKLLKRHPIFVIIKNKAVIAAAVLAGVAGITAIASAPYLMNTKPEFVMNGINAFNSHAQISWEMQSFAVLLTLAVTLLFAVYMRNRNPLLSLSAIFLLLPLFTMPFFQIWYLPFFFGYALLPQQKREMEITIVWLIFIMAVLGFGGISFNPLQVIDGWTRVLGI